MRTVGELACAPPHTNKPKISANDRMIKGFVEPRTLIVVECNLLSVQYHNSVARRTSKTGQTLMTRSTPTKARKWVNSQHVAGKRVRRPAVANSDRVLEPRQNTLNRALMRQTAEAECIPGDPI